MHTGFLFLAAPLLAGCVLMGSAQATAAADSPREYRVYFGTYTGPKSEGIYVSSFNPDTGELGAPKLAAKVPHPTFLALNASQTRLYAASEVGDLGPRHEGAILAYQVDPRTGHLDPLGQQLSGGSGPCHLSLSRDGKCVLVANYGSGSVAALPVKADGSLGPAPSPIQHLGSGANPQRQEGPHAHFIIPDPKGRFVLACDLGTDEVRVYRLDSATAALTPNDPPAFKLAPGAGPRHLSFARNGRFAYILNELNSTLTCCRYDARHGTFAEVQTVSTLPPDFHGRSTCAEIDIHESGKFLYASNRGHDSLALFPIAPQTGKVGPPQWQPTQGKTPRHFALVPGGRWLLAENQESDHVEVFRVDAKTGQLEKTGSGVALGAPVCAVFTGAGSR